MRGSPLLYAGFPPAVCRVPLPAKLLAESRYFVGLPQIIGSVPTDVTDYLTLLHENQDQVDQSIVNNYDQEDDNADQEQI